jgi:transcriptional regulator with XRE-family HTH domain
MEAVRAFSGQALQQQRHKRGLSLDALADLVGISRPNLIAYEKARRQPSPATLAALAGALSVHPARLSAVPASAWTLADMRAFAGFTKSEVAAELGVARATYDAMEAGRRQLRADLFEPLAALLGRSAATLRAAYGRSLSARA